MWRRQRKVPDWLPCAAEGVRSCLHSWKERDRPPLPLAGEGWGEGEREDSPNAPRIAALQMLHLREQRPHVLAVHAAPAGAAEGGRKR